MIPTTATLPKTTPWGAPEYTKELAPGLILVGTPIHGGLWLSPERWREFGARFPGFISFCGPWWLEEDCDMAAAIVLWPEAFPEEDLPAAREILRHWHKEVTL